MSTASDSTRLVVLRLTLNAAGSLALPTGQQYELGSGGYPSGAKFKAAPVPASEASAGALSATTLAQIKTDAGLGSFTVNDGHLTLNSARLSQYIADQAGAGQVWIALRLQASPSSSLALCNSACALTSDIRLFRYSRLGLQIARTQPSIPLPGGGSLAVDAETGNGVLSLFDPDALTANPARRQIRARRPWPVDAGQPADFQL